MCFCSGSSLCLKLSFNLCGVSGVILEEADKVLKAEFPELNQIQLHIPDESSRRVGQSVAAASLPELN